MKFRNAIYKKGRMIRATYLIEDPFKQEKIITENLVIIDDVFETDQDIVCINVDEPKQLIVIPNSKENVIELPTVLDQTMLNSILTKMNESIYQLEYKCS